jgi:hypothetical protein
MATWLLSLPLMVAGSQVAHVLAYAWVYPNAHVRLAELLATGHSYMIGHGGELPLALGMLGAVELVGVGWVLAGTLRRSLQRPVPASAFALLPLLGFALQELFERWLSGSSFPWWVVLGPTFRIGLALQLPFALLAYLAARALLRASQQAAVVLQTVDAVRPGACAEPPARACAGRGRGACTPAFHSHVLVRGPPAPALAP